MAEVRRLDPDSLALLQGAPAAQPGVPLQDCAELQSEGSLRRREGEFQLQLHIAALKAKVARIPVYRWRLSLEHLTWAQTDLLLTHQPGPWGRCGLDEPSLDAMGLSDFLFLTGCIPRGCRLSQGCFLTVGRCLGPTSGL